MGKIYEELDLIDDFLMTAISSLNRTRERTSISRDITGTIRLRLTAGI